MGAIALAAVGLAVGVGGTAMAASSAKKKKGELQSYMDKYLPNIDQYTDQYFDSMRSRAPEAGELADTVSKQDVARGMAAREQALPGFTEGIQGASAELFKLLKGELPDAVLNAFSRSGAASSVGSGFGGSGFGALNQGLFGARGALGAMQTGYGLLPALMSTLPNFNSPSSAAFLESIMTPAQRTQTQLQIRGQNLGVAGQVAGMPGSKDIWGGFLQQTGGAMFGAGLTGAMSGGGGSKPNTLGKSSGGFDGADWASGMA